MDKSGGDTLMRWFAPFQGEALLLDRGPELREGPVVPPPGSDFGNGNCSIRFMDGRRWRAAAQISRMIEGDNPVTVSRCHTMWTPKLSDTYV